MTGKRRWVYTLIRTKTKNELLCQPIQPQPKERPSHQKVQTNARLLSHAVPEVVCVEEAIELRVQIDDIDASLCSIPDNGTGKVASVVVLFSIDAQAAVNTKF